MATKVTINSSSPYRVAINNQQPKSVRTVAVTAVSRNRLSELTDVDVSGAENNETLVYDASSGKYIIKPLPAVDGGTF